MPPANDSRLPQLPDITVNTLRHLLVDLPGSWRLGADDSYRFVLVDDNDDPMASIDLAAGSLALHHRMPAQDDAG